MSYFTQKILMPTTAAISSEQFGMTVEDAALTVFCTGLQNDETAVLQYQDAFDSNWYDVKVLLPDNTSVTPTFTTTSNYISIQNDWGIYRFDKSATANPVGIFVRRFLNAAGGA